MIKTRYTPILRTACAAVLILVIWTACSPESIPTSAPQATAPFEATTAPAVIEPTTPPAAVEATTAPAVVEPTTELKPVGVVGTFFTAKITPLPAKSLTSADRLRVTTILTKELPKGYEVVQLPAPIAAKLLDSTAKIIPLPDPVQLDRYKAEITSQGPVLNPNFNPTLYNFTATAHTAGDFNLLAVPVERIPEFNFDQGVQAGMIFDPKGFYDPERRARALEVWFFTDHAELRSGKEAILKIPVGDKFYWDKNVEHVDQPRVVFVENGCWGCWSLDSSSGCIYCSR